MGWVGSHEMDPWTTLEQTRNSRDVSTVIVAENEFHFESHDASVQCVTCALCSRQTSNKQSRHALSPRSVPSPSTASFFTCFILSSSSHSFPLSLRPIFAAKVVNGSDLKVKTDFQNSQLSLVKCHQIGDELRTLRCLRRQATSSSKKSANSE